MIFGTLKTLILKNGKKSSISWRINLKKMLKPSLKIRIQSQGALIIRLKLERLC